MAGLIVHEWIEPLGGAEKVLDAITEVYPDAPLHCLWNDAPHRYPATHVDESWLARTPARNHKALALPFALLQRRTAHVPDDTDWVLASSHLFAHAVRVPPRIPKFAYVYTPARYIWAPELDPRGTSLPARIAAPALKHADKHYAQELTEVVGISDFVCERIQNTWGRNATTIYPPVDTGEISSTEPDPTIFSVDENAVLSSLPSEFVLGASRFVPYKQLDLVIEAGAEAGMPVVIAGRGPEEAALRRLAAQTSTRVDFVISPSDALLRELYRRASVFVFPAIEDFGIMPIEAQAAGTPTVTGPIGGARETLVEGLTGVAATKSTSRAMSQAIITALQLDRSPISTSVQRFSRERFQREVRDWLG